MKRYIILILMFTATCLNFGARADDRNGYTIEIKSDDEVIYSKENVKFGEQILLRDALNQILNGGNQKLYGDFENGHLFGGSGTRFTEKWSARGNVIKISRQDDQSPILLVIPSNITEKYSEELKATIRCSATKKDGSVDPNCAGDEIPFVVTIIPQKDPIPDGICQKCGKKTHEGKCHVDPIPDPIDPGINIMYSLPILCIILSLINLGLIIILFRKSSKGLEKSVGTRDHSKEINGIKIDIQNLKNLLSQKHLTEDDVKRIVISMTSTKSVVVPSPKPVSPKPAPSPRPVQTTESIDTLEYSFQENKFIVTRESQQIFVIHRNGNEYTFTLKDVGICQEIMPMLNAYSKCISVMGNTSSANGIGSVTPGVLYPTGDGRSFSVASPIIINFI